MPPCIVNAIIMLSEPVMLPDINQATWLHLSMSNPTYLPSPVQWREGDTYYVLTNPIADEDGETFAESTQVANRWGFNGTITSVVATEGDNGMVQVGMFCALAKNFANGRAEELPPFPLGWTYELDVTLTGILDGPANAEQPVQPAPVEPAPIYLGDPMGEPIQTGPVTMTSGSLQMGPAPAPTETPIGMP